MTQQPGQTLPQIGYLYHYPRLDHPTDNFRLDIHISSEPTNKHFDVLRTQFPVKADGGYIRNLKVTHPWNFEKLAQVSAGVVIMEDRKGRKEDAFTFGGKLTIENQENQVVCVLVSSAPILEMSGVTPLHIRFVEEVEIILAKIQAKYSDHQAYEESLIKAEPFALYLACLESILEKYEVLVHKTEMQHQLLIYLHTQMHRLETAGMIREPILHLDDLFD
jgi:hypothetical protein